MSDVGDRGIGRRALLAGLLAGVAVCAAPETGAQTVRERIERRRERRQERRERFRERREERRERRREDWDEVRDAVRRGEIAPLRDLMRDFEDITGHEIIDVRHRKVGGRHFYGFKVLTGSGRLEWFAMDAKTREILTPAEARSRYGQ